MKIVLSRLEYESVIRAGLKLLHNIEQHGRVSVQEIDNRTSIEYQIDIGSEDDMHKRIGEAERAQWEREPR